MLHELPFHIQSQFNSIPQTGVGYHTVDIVLENGDIVKDVTILNSSIALLENNLSSSIVSIRYRITEASNTQFNTIEASLTEVFYKLYDSFEGFSNIQRILIKAAYKFATTGGHRK